MGIIVNGPSTQTGGLLNMDQKTYLFDTNVLLHDPRSIIDFPGAQVVLPLTVLEELDGMKRLPNELGKNARALFRFLDGLIRSHPGDLHKGLVLSNGSTLRIQLQFKTDFNKDFSLGINDNKIIMTALFLKEKGEDVIFVTKDFAARIKAEAIGINSSDYESQKYAYENMYKGLQQVDLSKHEIDLFFKDGNVEIPDIEGKANEYFAMNSPEHSSAVGKFDPATKKISPLMQHKSLWGINPRNLEQKCAVDLLLRDDIKLVTLIGPAGTGKTLLALACGMRKVFDEGIYTKMLVSRPIVPMGRDIGYLPGTKEEKLFHWMQPIYDNLEFLCASSSGSDASETLRWVMDSKKIEMEAVTYIRGRSLPKMYMIVDEAQNLTPHEIKTIVSRAGVDTKVILTGDPTQIDNPYLDKDSNGLTYTVNRFAGHPIYGHMFLDKTERSELAAITAETL